MSKLKNKLWLSCKRATELIEKKSVAGLNIIERIQLNWHKKICDACRAYEKQSAVMDRALENSADSKKKDQDGLSEEYKSRLIKKITEKK